MNSKRYIIEEIETGRFVSWVTQSTGKIRYCKKPGTANYFLAATDAQNWADNNGLHHSRFRVRDIEPVGASARNDG